MRFSVRKYLYGPAKWKTCEKLRLKVLPSASTGTTGTMRKSSHRRLKCSQVLLGKIRPVTELAFFLLNPCAFRYD